MAALRLNDSSPVKAARKPRATAQPPARELQTLRAQVAALRKEVEAVEATQFELEVSRDHYANLHRFSPVGRLLLNSDGRIIDANLTAAVLLGHTREHLVNKPFALFLDRRDLGKFLEHLGRCRQSRARLTTELEMLHRDNSTVPMQLITAPIPTHGGDGALIFETALASLAERKEIEKSLRESEARLRLALESASAGTWEFDPASGDANWSEKFHTLLGTRPGAKPLTVSALIERFHPDDRKRARELIDRVSHGELEDLHSEFRIRHSGHDRWLAMHGRVVRYPRRGVRMMGIGMDITERKETEEFLRKSRQTLERRVKERTAEIRAANRTLEREVAERRHLEREILEISEREQTRIGSDLHDGLGQQITAIMLFNNTLQQKLAKDRHPEAAAAARVSALLGEAKDQLRQVVRGLQPVPPEPNGLLIGLDNFTNSIRELYRVHCRFTCPDPVLISDNVIATHLFRIAQEAVNNAFRHGHAKRIEVSLSHARNALVLEIRDDGDGIRKSRRKSAGFGLRTMQYRAEAMGGTFRVRRLPSRGTLIRCVVPPPPELNSFERP